MKNRSIGLDIFRIMCCIGVLIYHVVDDVLGSGGELAKIVYYGASYCVPGFFLLAGFLMGKRESLTIEYCEKKVVKITSKLLGWIIFWAIVHFIRTNEVLDIWGNLFQTVLSEGVLPVAWFLFTYDFLIVLAYPIHKMLKNKCEKWFVVAGVFFWMFMLALGVGNTFMITKPQSLWLHLYIGYFVTGMVLTVFENWYSGRRIAIKLGGAFILWIVMSQVYWNSINIIGGAPHQHYGKWYYMLWLISLFIFIINFFELEIFIKTHRIISVVARDTFTVYLGHLPILIYITTMRPLESLFEAVVCICFLFGSLVVMAEVFRRLPLLRRIV